MIQCIGFIMDGNRRWARSRNMPTLEGHRKGYEVLKRIIRHVGTSGISHMVCYAFSTENWKRAPEEVASIMDLMRAALTQLLIDEREEGVHYRIIGDRTSLPFDLQALIVQVEQANRDIARLTVWIALSYGGRAEIISAARACLDERAPITEESFARHLWTYGMPDPDLIIRTGGDSRISNFLLWSIAYSEFSFIDTLWPDFDEVALDGIVEEYGTRQRRKGA
jgi:undecaprenyl diphosphate synthase